MNLEKSRPVALYVVPDNAVDWSQIQTARASAVAAAARDLERGLAPRAVFYTATRWQGDVVTGARVATAAEILEASV